MTPDSREALQQLIQEMRDVPSMNDWPSLARIRVDKIYKWADQLSALLADVLGSPRPEKVWQCHFCGRDGVGEPFLGSIVTNGIERHPFFCSWKCRYAWAKSLYTASAEVVSQPRESEK